MADIKVIQIKWEYMALTNCDIATINKYGEDGWELVAVTKAEWGDNYIFKRPKEESV